MKVSKDKDDEYKHFDDETYDRDIVDNYLQVSLYNDSPEFKPIRKKHYYYTCNRSGCYNQLVHKHHRHIHNRYYHPNFCFRFINWLFCRN